MPENDSTKLTNVPSALSVPDASPTPAASSESSTLTNTSYSTNLVCADILKILSQSQSLSSQISSNLADLKNINNKVVNNESCSPTYSGILKSTYTNKPSTNSTNYLILGDFNYHFGSIETYHTEFTNLIYTLSLSQQLTFSSPTHIKNNILDLVITPSYPSFTLTHPKITNLITYHYSIQFTLDIVMALPKQVLR